MSVFTLPVEDWKKYLATSVKFGLDMTDADILVTARAALAKAAAAMEKADEALLRSEQVASKVEAFINGLPATLHDLGVLILTEAQSKYLIEQLTVAIARQVVEDAKQKTLQERARKDRWYDQRVLRYAAYATIGAFWVSLVIGLVPVLIHWAPILFRWFGP